MEKKVELGPSGLREVTAAVINDSVEFVSTVTDMLDDLHEELLIALEECIAYEKTVPKPRPFVVKGPFIIAGTQYI